MLYTNQRFGAGFLFFKGDEMKYLVLLLLVITNIANAATLTAERGFDVHTINGKEVKSDQDTYELLEGANQIVLSFDGKLSNGPKTEHLDTKPYVVVLEASPNSDIELSTISNKFKVVARAIDTNSSWLVFSDDSKELKYTSEVLPASSNYFPYANIPSLVKEYNREKKIYFANGEMKDIQELSQTEDTIVFKLQALYLEATPEQKKEFRKWIADYE